METAGNHLEAAASQSGKVTVGALKPRAVALFALIFASIMEWLWVADHPNHYNDWFIPVTLAAWIITYGLTGLRRE